MFLIPVDEEQTYGDQADGTARGTCSSSERLRPTASCHSDTPEAAPLHRNELAGTLHGLRASGITQDDAHIFCSRGQMAAELDACIDYSRPPLRPLRPRPRAEFSTRAGHKLGSDEEWDVAEGHLEAGAETTRDRIRGQ